MSYDPEWLEVEKELGSRPLLSGSPEEIIQQFNGLVEYLGPKMPPPDESVKTEERGIEDIPCRLYWPPDADGKKLPVGVYTHGGGFICGNLDSEDPICRAVAKNTPCIIVSVDYRLGPKHKLPKQVDDTYNVLKWVHKNADSLGGDQSKVFTIGGSAGGGLALLCAHRSAEDKTNMLKGVVAMVPTTLHPDFCPSELKGQYKSYRENGSGVPVIDKASMDTFYDAVLADPRDPDNFVALSKHHAKFPPTYISTCEFDPLRDDGQCMEKLLKDAGVPVKSDFWPGMPHYFHIFPQISKGPQFVGGAIGGTQWVLSQ